MKDLTLKIGMKLHIPRAGTYIPREMGGKVVLEFCPTTADLLRGAAERERRKARAKRKGA